MNFIDLFYLFKKIVCLINEIIHNKKLIIVEENLI